MNMLLLFCVALEPYLFFVLQSKSSDLSFLNWASFGYALDVGAMFLILGGLIRPILRGKSPGIERGYLHPVLFRRFRVAMFFYAFIGGAYLVSALPFFWIGTPIGPLRFVFWYSAFAFAFLGILNRRRGEHIERNALYDLQLDWTSLADYFLELVDRCAHGQNCYQ